MRLILVYNLIFPYMRSDLSPRHRATPYDYFLYRCPQA